MVEVIDGLFYDKNIDAYGKSRSSLIGLDFITKTENNFFRELILSTGDDFDVLEFEKILPITLYRHDENSLSKIDDNVVEVSLEGIKRRGEGNNFDFIFRSTKDSDTTYVESSSVNYLNYSTLRRLNSNAMVLITNLYEKKFQKLTTENEFAKSIFETMNLNLPKREE